MRHFSIIITIILFFSIELNAQQPISRNELEKRRQAIVESLKETQDQLEATKKDHKATMSQLQALQAKLNAREKLISNINQEMGHLDNDIKSSSNDVITLRSNLSILQERYAQSVRYAYSNRSSYNTLAFIFSSGDFNDALRRMKYMKKYRDYRKNQVEDIKLTQNKIENKINVLNSVKTQKGVLLTAEEQQKLAIQEERNQTTVVVNELKGREQELVKDLDNKRKSAKRLDNAISEAIRKEIEIARKKAEDDERRRKADEMRKAAELAAAQKAAVNQPNVYGSGNSKVILGSGARYDVPTPSTTTNTKPAVNKPNNTHEGNKPNYATANTSSNYAPVATAVNRTSTGKARPHYTAAATPESSELSKSFESNRGRLPWPVERGVVTDPFGKHKHAIATKVEIDNYGIDIQTSQGAKARAVYEGVVTSIMPDMGLGQTVLVKHGNYWTVYSRLSNVNVKVGQSLASKDIIGTVANNEDGVAVMNFQVWKGGVKLNPSSWVTPM
jgi:murein hydrolase activator